MFTNGTLAGRIEAAEAALVFDVATGVARRRADDVVFVQPLGGGIAVFAGPDSPVNKIAGLGFDTLTEADLERVERELAARGAPVRVEVATLADPAIGTLLTRRGYELRGFENVLGLSLPLDPPAAPAGITITAVPPDDMQWGGVVSTGFAHPDEFDGPPPTESFERDAIEQVMDDMSAVPGFQRYLAWRNDVVAGGAGLRLFKGIAQLSGAATLPHHRRHGVQTALLHRRLDDASRAGCDIAVVTTEPGSKSQQNVQRQGFALLYARAVLVKE